MSHLIHVVALKNEMLAKGITCPIEQHHLCGEAYVRAILRHYYAQHGQWSEELQKKIWVQLDRWNSVSPIPAQAIMTTATQRLNILQGNLVKDGSPGCSSQYTTFAEVGGEKLDIASLETFPTLVDYLTEELVNRHE